MAKRKSSVIMAGAAVMAMGLVTACGNGGTTNSNSTSNSAGGGTKANDVQIFSWWTAGGEAAGLKAVMKTFKQKYPNEKITNDAVAGGGGSNAKAVLANRMHNGNPPDSFQVHAGAELMAWVNAGQMQPLNSLYKSQGWNKVFPKEIINSLSKNGNIYAVPVDVGRGNVLWYNPSVLKKNNITPPKTMSEFMADLKKLKGTGVVPLVYSDKDQFGSTSLFENVLLATMGAQQYNQLWQGKVKWSNPKVKQATQTFVNLLQYTNSNHSALTWDQADQEVADGKAAFNLMGDWAKAFFKSKGIKESTGFGWTDFPGTNGDFMYVIDSFGLPKGAPNPTGAKDFLKLIGSKQGQDEFNPLKGSIPPRTDGNASKYDKYSQQAMADFKKDNLVTSMANGEAANPAFAKAATQNVEELISNKNVDTFIKNMEKAAKNNPLS